jgi:hypothetical protein
VKTQILDNPLFAFLLLAALMLVFLRRRWRGSNTAFGTASWMGDKELRAVGMLGKSGLVLGRTVNDEADPIAGLLPCSLLRGERFGERREHRHSEPAHLPPGFGRLFRHQGRPLRNGSQQAAQARGHRYPTGTVQRRYGCFESARHYFP